MSKTKNILEEELNREIDAFMGMIISAGSHMAPSEFAYQNFRKDVLGEGNKLKRKMGKRMLDYRVSYTLTGQQVKEQILDQPEKTKEENGSVLLDLGALDEK